MVDETGLPLYVEIKNIKYGVTIEMQIKASQNKSSPIFGIFNAPRAPLVPYRAGRILTLLSEVEHPG